MPSIHLKTIIRAPADLCFDLARDVDMHMAAATRSGDRAVAGVTSGMVSLGDEITWEGVHFGVRQHLTSRIVIFERPQLFVDEMKRGPFKRWRHVHLFVPKPQGTLMVDEVSFESPLGPLGRVADELVLKRYMTRLLVAHNEHIRKVAEQTARGSVRATARGSKFRP